MEEGADHHNVAIQILKEGLTEVRQETKSLRERINQIEASSQGFQSAITACNEKLSFIFSSLQRQTDSIESISKSQASSTECLIKIQTKMDMLSGMESSFREIQESHRLKKLIWELLSSSKFWALCAILTAIIVYYANDIKNIKGIL